MAEAKVIWTKLAQKSFNDEFDYLSLNWTNKEIAEFVQNSHSYIEVISKYPSIGRKVANHLSIREVVINPKIILLYKTSSNKVMLIEF